MMHPTPSTLSAPKTPRPVPTTAVSGTLIRLPGLRAKAEADYEAYSFCFAVVLLVPTALNVTTVSALAACALVDPEPLATVTTRCALGESFSPSRSFNFWTRRLIVDLCAVTRFLYCTDPDFGTTTSDTCGGIGSYCRTFDGLSFPS